MTEPQNRPIVQSFGVQQTKKTLNDHEPIEYVFCSESGPWKCRATSKKTPYNTRKEAKNETKHVVTVNFALGSDELDLDARSKILNTLPSLRNRSLILAGYTDSLGSFELNESLAHSRSESVKKFLVDLGFKSESLSTEANPLCCYINKNDRSSDRRRNRRVEILFKAAH